MSVATVADKLCQYFGGPYDVGTHTYRTPQLSVPNMDGPIVRRAGPKRDDHVTDYSLGNPGVPIGCLIEILLEGGLERRVAVAGAVSGVKQVRHNVKMYCFLRCEVDYAEDAQDASYALVDSIRRRLEADRTCGTGGFEAGYEVGFQVGEGGEPWIQWKISPIHTVKELSKGFVFVEFDADEYLQA